jgi:hypothetical protein
MLGKETIDPYWRFFNEDGSDMPLEHYPVSRVVATGSEFRNLVMGVFRPITKDVVSVLVSAVPETDDDGNIFRIIVTFMDITNRKKAEEVKDKLLIELREVLASVKTLSGLLPICSYCKKIRDDKGYYHQIESYISDHTEVDFSHGICPDCAEEHFPEEWNSINT